MKTQTRTYRSAQIAGAVLLLMVVISSMVHAKEPKVDLKSESATIELSKEFRSGFTARLEVEEALMVEKWMLKADRKYWGSSGSEADIPFDCWMVDLQKTNRCSNNAEPELLIESWMFDLSSWAKG